MYPKLSIDLSKLDHNIKTILKLCEFYHLEVVGVTKVLSGHPDVAQTMMEAGLSILSDSRCENLLKYQSLPVKKMLLRLPMLSELEDVVMLADISLHSEVVTLKAINEIAKNLQLIHEVMIMVDMGDLREGIFYQEELDEVIETIKQCTHLRCIGIGTNLSCYGGLIPNQQILTKLVNLQRYTVNHLPSCKVISGGNSSTLHLMLTERTLPPITQLRLGESLFLGVETAYGMRLEDTYDDVCLLEAEVIEVKHKPSAPQGKIGRNAFGEVKQFKDVGERFVCICAVGLQDTDVTMTPCNEDLRILGASSDHLLLEITNGSDIAVGDILSFKLSYGSLLKASTSPYVNKEMVKSFLK